MAEKVTNNAPCPTCGRTVGFRPVSEFLAEVREHNAALTTARAEAEGLRGEVEALREVLRKIRDIGSKGVAGMTVNGIVTRLFKIADRASAALTEPTQ